MIGKVGILREIWSYSLFFSILVSNIDIVMDNKCIVSGDICLVDISVVLGKFDRCTEVCVGFCLGIFSLFWTFWEGGRRSGNIRTFSI